MGNDLTGLKEYVGSTTVQQQSLTLFTLVVCSNERQPLDTEKCKTARECYYISQV